MWTRADCWLGTASVFAALLMAVLVFAGFAGMDAEAVTVILPHACSTREKSLRGEFEAREVFVHYMANGQSVINDSLLLPVEGDLRRTLRGLMATHAEPMIYFDADADLSYGEVDGLLRLLKEDTPELGIWLMTSSQMKDFVRRSSTAPLAYVICESR